MMCCSQRPDANDPLATTMSRVTQTHTWIRRCAAAGLAILATTVGCPVSGSDPSASRSGLEYELRELQDPRPNRAHILCVDLSNPEIKPVVVVADDPDGDGPAETALTDPRKLANHPQVIAYINTNPWNNLPDEDGGKTRGYYDGRPVDIRGWAVSEDETRSPSEGHTAAVWVGESGKVTIGNGPGIESAAQAMAGFQPVLLKGSNVTDPSEVRHPRTAIGLNREGTVMWLVVVDGRQDGFSEGMSLFELAELMKDLGCWDAVNMDGGGSSIMGLRDAAGELDVVNSPSGRLVNMVLIRPLPTILTIQENAPR